MGQLAHVLRLGMVGTTRKVELLPCACMFATTGWQDFSTAVLMGGMQTSMATAYETGSCKSKVQIQSGYSSFTTQATVADITGHPDNL